MLLLSELSLVSVTRVLNLLLPLLALVQTMTYRDVLRLYLSNGLANHVSDEELPIAKLATFTAHILH